MAKTATAAVSIVQDFDEKVFDANITFHELKLVERHPPIRQTIGESVRLHTYFHLMKDIYLRRSWRIFLRIFSKVYHS
jgi:hypothetical protein